MAKRRPSRMEALAVLRGEQAHYLSWGTKLGNTIASALGTTIEVLEGTREPSGSDTPIPYKLTDDPTYSGKDAEIDRAYDEAEEAGLPDWIGRLGDE